MNAIQLPTANAVQKCNVADRLVAVGQPLCIRTNGLHMPDKLRHRQDARFRPDKGIRHLGAHMVESRLP